MRANELEGAQTEYVKFGTEKGFERKKVTADKNSTRDKLLKNFYRRLSKKIIKQLYSVYKIDFEMFQYVYPQEYIDMGY